MESRRESSRTTSNGHHGTNLFRLSQEQRESICNQIESYISRGWDRAVVYWPDGEVCIAPERVGKRERV